MSLISKKILDELDTVDTLELYDGMLRECFGDTVNIAGYPYDVARVFRDVDEIAYTQGLCDYLDTEVTNGILYTIDGEKYYYQVDVDELIEEELIS